MIKIGVVLRSEKDYMYINNELIEYLDCYNVALMGIVLNENMDFNKITEIIELCDGVILPGGYDYSNIDIKIANYLYKINKPTLGICLGMQCMSIAMNGNIEILDSNIHNSKDKYVHSVKIKKNTRLYKILGNQTINVNSRHNYSVINTKLEVNAYSKDFVIEGVEALEKNFYIGVQWHPESLNDDIYSKLLIEEFIDCCS